MPFLITLISCLSQLGEILKFGVDKLLSSDESTVQDVKLEKILGLSRDGHWVDESTSHTVDEEDDSESDGQSRFYYPVAFVASFVLSVLHIVTW